MPPKFDVFGTGEYPKTALASELLRHPSETEGVSVFERARILQGSKTLVTNLERVGRAAIFTDADGELQPRADQFLRVTIDGFGYGIRETCPDTDEANGLNIIHFPGFGEVIEAGSAYNLHTSLATQFPGARVVSVASDGVGTISEKLSLGNVFDHGIKGMGEGRGKLIKALFGDQPVLVTSCSMGSAITQEMLDLDVHNGHNLNVYPLYYDTAVVEPGKTWLFMGVMFPGHTVLDVSFELMKTLVSGDYQEIKELAKMAEQRGGDGLPMMAEVIGLMGGIAISVSGHVSEVYQGTTISGASDPLRRNSMWGHIKKEYNPNLHIVRVPWRGHGMAMRGKNAGLKIRHEVDHYGIVTQLLDAA
jgi:hypothetical protein